MVKFKFTVRFFFRLFIITKSPASILSSFVNESYKLDECFNICELKNQEFNLSTFILRNSYL